MYPDFDTYEPLYPAQDTIRHVVITLIKVAWQIIGNKLPVFHLLNEHNPTEQHKHEGSG